jgi:outer membrane protein assembly factor BamB
MQRLKSGPSEVPRRLVAIDDTVYATLSLDAPVTALDAATGRTQKTYEATDGTDEILYSDGVLYLVVNRDGYTRSPFKEWTQQERTVMAVKADTGDVLWEKTWPWVIPGCLALHDNRAVFFDGERVIALDRKTGDRLWQSEKLGRRSPVPVYFSPCLVLYKDPSAGSEQALVLFSGSDPDTGPYHADNGKTMYAFSAETGKTLWKQPHAPSGYRSAEDILVVAGLVWNGDIFNSRDLRTEQTGTFWGRDPYTGQVKVEFMPDVDTHWFHHRCYRAKATENYLLTSRTGIEFVDFRNQHWTCHHWVRGACLYGVMPANGMVYTPPHPCACYLEAKQFGFNALAAHSKQRQQIIDHAEKQERLEKGPAYGTLRGMKDEGRRTMDWPTLRADFERSGRVEAQIPLDTTKTWQTKIGGRLSSPVVANGQLFVAAIDAHQIRCLDADTGVHLWRYTAGARIDSPPTIWKGRVLFGSADGYVYCLRSADGQLIWRYRAAPANLRMGSFGQIESVWPVHGSVLIRENDAGTTEELWCVAGRSMFLDGGLRLLRFNPATGEKIAEKILDDRVPGTDENLQAEIKGLNMPVALSDVLVEDGKFVYMKSQQFDSDGNRIDIDVPTRNAREQKGETAHLFCPTGLLDDAWWHRSYWVYGRVWKSGAGGYYQSGRFATSGRPMVFDEDKVYSFGRKPQYYRWTTPMEYMLYTSAKQPAIEKIGKDQRRGLGAKPGTTIRTQWQQDVPILVRAMVLADDTLFLAGPADLIDEHETQKTLDAPETQELLARQASVLQGSEGAFLRAVSVSDGKKLSEKRLDDVPVFDGMIAAGNSLYYATMDGRVVCLGNK